ncbi:hypothetical protein HED60_18695 [Planctomycetales bacterium ZRK34]|nr:hypothetical protein HED60_18695 [Planctomycetales bacterium ZRK34]
MPARHSLFALMTVVTCLGLVLCLTVPAAADMTAPQLLDQGKAQLEAGELDAAKTTLSRIDPIQLTKDQRLQLQQALQMVRDKQRTANAPTPPTPVAEESSTPAPAPAKPAAEKPKPEPKPEPVAKPAPKPDPKPAPAPKVVEKPENTTVITEPTVDGEPAKVEAPKAEAPKMEKPKAEEPKVEVTKAQKPKAPKADKPKAEAKPAETVAEAPAAPEPSNGEMLLQQAAKLRTQQLVAEADEAAKQGQYNRASQLYNQALSISPDNAEAGKGLETVRALLGRDTGTNLVEDYANVVKLRGEQAKARYDEAMAQARQSLAAGNPNESLDAVSLAKAIIDTNRQYLSEAEYARMSKAAGDFTAQVQTQAEQARMREKLEGERQVKAEQIKRRMRAEEERDRKVQELLHRANDLRRELNYEEALDVLNQLLFLDKHNVAAQAMQEMINDAIVYRNTRDLQRKRELLRSQQSVDNNEAALPYTELIQYPPDWPQLTATRLQALGEAGADSEVNRRIMEKLKQPIPVTFDGNRLENVIEYLRNVTGVDFFVNWRALEGAGIEPGTTVTLQLASVPGDKALQLILDQVGGDLVPLGYTVDDGVVTISTQENLGKNTVFQTYDIRDLVVQAPSFDTAPDFDLTAISRGRGSGGGGGSQQTNLFQDSNDETAGVSRGELIQQIMQLIRDTVDPDSWRTNGGLVSSMSELNGSLIVNTTSENHRKIISLLAQLRESRALQINVEARFLLVDQNYLDEVGVDMDITITDPGGDLTPISILTESFNVADRQNTNLTGSFGSPDTGSSPADGTFSRGLSVSGGFMNDIQVDLLIRATQANRRSTQLTAPRVTFFNGQRAYVLVATQLSYISDLDPVVGTRSAAFDPEISVVSSGVILDIEGTVSADRRYVTLTARPSLARVIRLRQLTVLGTTVDNTGDDDTGGSVGIPDSATGLIEAPELELTTVRTTVSVPDKGTLLLGGQRLFADVEIEAGVPVLSKIPVINRLFTNRSTVKDERTLLILIKPTILIQSEKENELFPGLNQSSKLFGGTGS